MNEENNTDAGQEFLDSEVNKVLANPLLAQQVGAILRKAICTVGGGLAMWAGTHDQWVAFAASLLAAVLPAVWGVIVDLRQHTAHTATVAGLTAQVVMQRSIIASCPTLPAAAIAPSAPPQAQPLTIPGGVANSAPDALKG